MLVCSLALMLLVLIMMSHLLLKRWTAMSRRARRENYIPELRVALPSFGCSRSAVMHRRAKLLAPVKGGAGHGKHLPTLRVQLCMLNRGAVQSKPGGSRRLAQQ